MSVDFKPNPRPSKEVLEVGYDSFVPFQKNASMNKIKFTLTTLLNELQHFQNLTMDKGKEVEAIVATLKKEFTRGSSSKTKVGHLQMKKKGKGKTPKKIKGKKVIKGKSYHCNQNGYSLRNFPKYLAEKEAQGKYDLLTVEMKLVLEKLLKDEIILKVWNKRGCLD
ncbi:gag/pol protein [Cucumis melo var. makuwa]|uniref:Gag/pol protein n=1 Tax=Cucumis melo var. makuwa TaxID=1194695 RepID=A0A5A7V6N3_CUCMM|nr:gag/pol protein [Cucumis melo var. makuwa]TYK05154.1 gag/pol protein [Cucumis melo var. makuwa]